MNAEGELLRAYREWHRLVRTEGRAIETRNWSLLTDCHLAVRDYQTLVLKLTQEARSEWRQAGCDLAEKERQLRSLVAGLVEVTRDNHHRLQSALATARQRLGHLTDVGINLKRLHRSYGTVATARRAL